MSLFPRNVNEYLLSLGIPRGPNSQAYIVDPVNGSDSNPGTSFAQPLKTVEAAYALCTADQHDAVVMIAGDTADNPAASITWSKDYTHLVGLSGDLPGVGQRCRIVGTAALDLTPVVTFSGNGCIVKNVQIYNGKDSDTDCGAVIVSGSRNVFKNVFFAGMAHATPAARAGSYSLKVTGSENLFDDCAIGLDTIIRAAANKELWLSTGNARNIFRHCRILSHSDTAGHLAVLIDDLDRWVEFDSCIFQNFSTNWSQALTDAISITETTTHYVILRGDCQFVGYTGIADTVTHVYGAGAAPNAGMFLSTQPTT